VRAHSGAAGPSGGVGIPRSIRHGSLIDLAAEGAPGRRTIGIRKTPRSGMVTWTAAPCWTDSMRRMRVNVPSCGEVAKARPPRDGH
jgi:hypothetical protein